MSTHELIFAGFGGQGVLTMGQILAYAGMKEGRKVSWYPAYGPEQRGGTANCSVVISEQPVASPVVAEPTACVVMNQASADKFTPLVAPGGVLVVNTSMVARLPQRPDIRIIPVAATEEAIALGNAKVANIVALGALLAATGAAGEDAVLYAVGKLFGTAKAHLLAINQRALERGMALVPVRAG